VIPAAPNPRRAALLVWTAMLAFLLAFLAMELALDLPRLAADAPRGLLLGLAAATSMLGIALSRLLPLRIPARQAGGGPAALALLRLVVAWALCEGAALFALAAHLLTHDDRLLGIFAVDLLALATLYPGERLWGRLSAEPATAPRMVR